MKKTILLIILMMIIVPMIGYTNEIKAESPYGFGCSLYELSYIEDDGSFTKVECYNNFNDAKEAMKTNPDYVVRHVSGYSASKIIAMNEGLVYSYPRGNSSVQNIYQEYTNRDNYASSYVSRGYEMSYIETSYVSTKSGFEGTGWIKIILNGFEGYCDLEYVDLVPSKFIDKKIPIYLAGAYANNNYDFKRMIVNPNYYVVKQNNNYLDLEFHYHYLTPTSSTNENIFEGKIVVDNAANYDFLKAGFSYYSDDGINFYTNYKKNEFVGKAYNYYQFLPLRSKTNISDSAMNSFLISSRSDYQNSVLNNKGSAFINAQNKYGCNAATIYAMACLESAYGTSGYATNRNNLFGWNAYDDSPSDASYFSSVDVCVNEQMGRNLRGYLDVTDSRFNGSSVGNKGAGFNVKYASDPYWGQKIASIYYKMDKHANNNNGKLSDYNNYDLGVITTFNTKIYSDLNLTNVLYSSAYRNNVYQKDHIIIILERIGNVYKIQTTNPIENGNLVVDYSTGLKYYNYENSIAYINVDDVEVLYDKEIEYEKEHDAFVSIANISYDDNILNIEGISAITNLSFADKNSVKHYIGLYNIENDELVKEFEAQAVLNEEFSMNDSYDYSYVGFELSIDLNTNPIEKGSYYLKVKTTNSDITKETILRSSNDKYALINKLINDVNYRFTNNYLYNYRIELDVESTGLDYSIVNKPSGRKSLVSFDYIRFLENDSLAIEGQGLIYYLNYDQVSDINYEVYLVNDKEDFIKLNTSLVSSNIDWKLMIGSSYNLDNICFKATLSKEELSNLDGNYRLYLKINNSEYVDIIEFVNRSYRDLASTNIDNKNYSFVTSKIRDRIELNVKKISEE